MALISRDEVAEQDTWNLTPLYPSLEAWRSDFAELESRLGTLQSFQGTLGESAARINEAFRCYLALNRELEKLYVYAHLRSDGDIANSENLGLLDQATNLSARFSAAASYLTPELLEIDEEKLATFLDDPLLADLRRMLRDIVRYKPHTLSKNEENLLALGSEVFGASGRIFSQLNNADLTFGTVSIDGKEETLTHGNFILFLKNPQREVRRAAFERYYRSFEQHKNTISAALTSSIKKDVYLAKVRKFDSCLSRAVFGDNVSTKVYESLIANVNDGLSALHRYYRLRGEILELDEQRMFDTYVPLVPDTKVSHSYEEAAGMVVESLAPLGEGYTAVLRDGLTQQRWVDRYENKGKRSGAYSSGCYDSAPYILMNYKPESLNDVFTLTHEAGHSMHSYFSNRAQPYQDHWYTIFVAEVASTFNEQLLSMELKRRYADNPRMLAYLINQQIDDIKATFYRQTMFAEYEKIIHEMAERNEPLTVDAHRAVYRELLSKYFGPAVTLSELDDLECFRIPHFYSAFYVYKYATGLAAAITLAKKVTEEGESARERYLSFLKGGCSKYPLELLKDAGVDMTGPEPVQATLTLFNSLLDELEALDLKSLRKAG